MIQNGGLAAGSQEPFFVQFRSHKITPVCYGKVLLVHQVFKGDFPFPFPLQAPDGGDSSMAYNSFTICVMGSLNSHLIFRFRHGKSPFL